MCLGGATQWTAKLTSRLIGYWGQDSLLLTALSKKISFILWNQQMCLLPCSLVGLGYSLYVEVFLYHPGDLVLQHGLPPTSWCLWTRTASAPKPRPARPVGVDPIASLSCRLEMTLFNLAGTYHLWPADNAPSSACTWDGWISKGIGHHSPSNRPAFLKSHLLPDLAVV